MGNSPKANEEKMQRVIYAWETLAPDKQFGGMKLADLKAAVQPALDTRKEIQQLESQLKEAKRRRKDVDEVAMSKVQLVSCGVVADPSHGPDSALIEAMGYTRESAHDLL